MDIVPLTLVISLCLTFTFIVFFAREQSRRRFGSPESDSLLPLLEEKQHAPGTVAPAIVKQSDLPPRVHQRGQYPESHA